MTRVPNLAKCTPESFFKCLLDLSALGLEPDGRRAHLIPHHNRKLGTYEATLIVDYKGLVELVRRDPDVIDVQCYTIREHDRVMVHNGKIEHTYDPLEDRGEVRAVYTRIDWKGGHTSYGEPMTRAEAEAVRKRSRAAKDGPWVTDFVEMWRKSAIRRDSKMWPLSSEIREAIERDDREQFDERDVTPARPMLRAPLENRYG